jgi:threonine synthase
MSQDAPEIDRKEIAITGAQLYLVEGLISDAGKKVERAVRRFGWFDA